MKTTIDIQDGLFASARRLASKNGTTLRAVVEEGLRRVLAERAPITKYHLVDCSVGHASDADPLPGLSWDELRREIYSAKRGG